MLDDLNKALLLEQSRGIVAEYLVCAPDVYKLIYDHALKICTIPNEVPTKGLVLFGCKVISTPYMKHGAFKFLPGEPKLEVTHMTAPLTMTL